MRGYLVKREDGMYLNADKMWAITPHFFSSKPEVKEATLLHCEIVIKNWVPVKLADIFDCKQSIETVYQEIIKMTSKGELRIKGAEWQQLQ